MTQIVVSSGQYRITQPALKSSRLTITNVRRDLAGMYFCAGETILGRGKPRGAKLDVTCKY